ncbi:hypothetical protein ACEYYB_02410 [Paracoccus sp. p4-l81]|uniref:head-tail connector protein n=1 Tax=Paracoccus sp. p4-l81 TaxID=3342806 RepID=UPI0035B72FFA
MMVIEEGALAAEALPIQELRDQLRLGGADGGTADGLLGTHLRAAMAAIEARTGKVLIARRFRWRFAGWRDADGQPLPLAPVAQVHEVAVIAGDGTRHVVDPARWRLVADLHRPRVSGRGGALPAVDEDGFVEIDFTAGFATQWDQVPPDLRHAVMLLAARYHEDRVEGGQGQAAALPFGVSALIERFRSVRILGGRGRR